MVLNVVLIDILRLVFSKNSVSDADKIMTAKSFNLVIITLLVTLSFYLFVCFLCCFKQSFSKTGCDTMWFQLGLKV